MLRHPLVNRACLALAVTLSLRLEAVQNVRPDIDFEATRLDGGRFNAGALRGRMVLLDFWAVWCPPCIAAIPALNRSRDFAPGKFEVVAVALYSGEPAEVSRFAREHSMRYTVVVGDEDLVERFQVIGFPTYFLIGPDGNIVRKYVGELKGFEEILKADVRAIQEKKSKLEGRKEDR